MGNAFAMLQVKTILAILLRGFSFELMHDPVIAESGLVMGPRKPFRLRYRRLRPNGAF
jgi:cytochrome P450